MQIWDRVNCNEQGYQNFGNYILNFTLSLIGQSLSYTQNRRFSLRFLGIYPPSTALLHESYLGYHGRMLFFVQLIFSTRYDWGLPRWIIRLRMAQPKRLSTCWLAQLRAFSLSPMRCL